MSIKIRSSREAPQAVELGSTKHLTFINNGGRGPDREGWKPAICTVLHKTPGPLSNAWCRVTAGSGTELLRVGHAAFNAQLHRVVV